MNGNTRDFSQQSVQELRDIIRKNLQDNQWGFFDWFDDTFLMQELNIKNYINNVNEYHAKMIDKHNMGSEEFDRILERVHTVDENYSARINSLVDQAKALQTRIEQLTKMIDPSVITANPGDFARLADGIDSKYQKVKVQSEARMKQCEASMPVLYDKQWYENVVDSIKAGANVAGQVGEGIGWGLVDVAKDLVFGVKDTAVELFHYLTNNPEEENAFFIANIYVQSEKQNKSVPQFLWDSLKSGIWNGLQTSADDFAKGDLKTKSEMATRLLGNLALFAIPATKIGTAGEAVELGSKAGRAAEIAEDINEAKTAEEVAELAESTSKAESNTCASIKAIINANGYSVDEFTQLLHPDRALSEPEKLLVNTVRKEISPPSADTFMCKTIPQSDIYKYLYNEYDEVRGFTAVKEHVSSLKTLLDRYDGIRLDYNNTAFKTQEGVDGISQSIGLPDKFYGTIEYKVNDVDKISVPSWEPKPDDYPYTGRGFTGSTNVVLPEYFQGTRKFVDGDIIKVIDGGSGKVVQKFIYDADTDEKWIALGGK